jgi:hypothetical protein
LARLRYAQTTAGESRQDYVCRALYRRREEFRMMRQDYEQQFDLYTRQRAALASLRAYIQSTISRNCLYYTFESETAREMLIELQKLFKPTDQLRELDLTN